MAILSAKIYGQILGRKKWRMQKLVCRQMSKIKSDLNTSTGHNPLVQQEIGFIKNVSNRELTIFKKYEIN